MIYYADYEALEFNNVAALDKNIYPYYLDSTKTETSLCPIYFAASDKKGELVEAQNVTNRRISFLSFLDNIIKKNGRNTFQQFQVWFHNIEYDFRIIVHELFYNGFKNIVDSETMQYEGEYSTEKTMAFSIIGANLSSYKGINLYYRGFKILIRDTMAILNSAQDKILEEFNFKKKVEIDWDSITIDNLFDNMDDIKDRCEYDVKSLSLAIEQFRATFYDHFKGKGTTAAGMSFDALRYFLCSQNNIDYETGISEPSHEEKNDVFRDRYPKLSGEHLELSAATYHGGICTINKEYAGKVLYNLQMVDINSSYPYAMTKELPYGEGKICTNFRNDGYSEYVVYVKFSFRRDTIPFQRCHSESRARRILGIEPSDRTYSRSQFPRDFKGYLCINSIDLQTLKKYANVETLRFVKGVTYKVDTMLSDFIVPIYNERKQSEGVKKLAIKLLLNSLYGKFAQDLSGLVNIYDSIDDYHKIRAIDNETFYKPFASAVTSHARRNWVDCVYKLGRYFVYGDTDSVYFLNPIHNMRCLVKSGLIHKDELGKWSPEYGRIEKGKFLSKKNYIIVADGKQKVTCVGLSHKYHAQVTFDNFEINSTEFKVKKMVNIYGGKAMKDTVFKIRERVI